MGEVKPGDFVLSPRGEPVLVVGTTDVDSEADCFELTFDTGESIQADGRHLWFTKNTLEREEELHYSKTWRENRKKSRTSRALASPKNKASQKRIIALNKSRIFDYKIPSPGTIRNTYEIYQTLRFRGRINHSIQLTKPLEFPDADLPLDPYLFGLWLGDGFSGTGVIGMNESDIDALLPFFPSGTTFRMDVKNRKTPFKMARIPNLTSLLRKIDVFKNKHVPVAYQRASLPQRLALLQGIMDTDGSISKRDGTCELGFSNKKLIDDALELIAGLGIKTRITKRRAKINGRDVGETYRLTFLSPLPVFRLSRKLAFQKMSGFRSSVNRRFIVDVKKIPSTPMRCIQVNHPDGLYLLGSTFIATHNSFWLRWYPIRTMIKWGAQYNLRGIHGALFSKDFPTLKDRQISKMAIEFPEWLGELKDSKTDGLGFHIKPEYGGHILALRNLDDPSKYLSSEFAIIAVEELTENPEDIFDRLRFRLRWTGISQTKFIAATNPGGTGHSWVKKRWIDRDFPIEEKEQAEFAYVRALPTDNPHLASNYLTILDSLPERLRKAYKEGDWDVFAGQYFSEFNRAAHSIAPFPIPPNWRRVRGIDHGRTAPTACLWGALDQDGNLFIYREYYMAGLDADVNAQNIHNLSIGEKYWFTVIDSATFAKTGSGETIHEIYARNGVTAEPAPKNRLAGWALLHEYLRPDPITEQPRLKFFTTCLNSIRSIPSLVHDQHNPEDLDSNGDDHVADGISYILQSMHEGKSPVLQTALEKKMREMNIRNRITPQTLNSFYGRR